MRYGPDAPEGLMTFGERLRWCPQAFHWYNNPHHHESLAHFTPADVYSASHLARGAVREQGLDQSRTAHPERLVRGRRAARQVPGEVLINRPEQHPITTVPQVAVS